jgi:hypothetical protein
VFVRAVVTVLLLVFCVLPYNGSAAERQRLGVDAMSQVEQSLRQAAVSSPRWHNKQAAIQRDIEDIVYWLDEAGKASRSGNVTAQNQYAHHALALLHRAVIRGHFDPDGVKPVLLLIQRLLPAPSV